MKERLIELMRRAENKYLNLLEFEKDILAEYLLENGVIVPPCKVGDALYWIDNEDNTVKKEENAVRGIVYFGDDMWKTIDSSGSMDTLGTQYAYLSKEEAQKALGGAKK